MRRKSPRRCSLSEYIAEVLKNSVYEKGEQLDVIVAEAPRSPRHAQPRPRVKV